MKKKLQRESIKSYSTDQLSKMKDKTDHQPFNEPHNKTIGYSDSPEASEELWAKAKIYDPGKKTPISIRIDNEVLEWFKSQNGRYQKLMNGVLRRYMRAHQ